MKINSLRGSLLILFARLWRHISPLRRRQFFLVIGLMFFSAISETITLGSLLPFVGILIAPERIFDYVVISEIAKSFGVTSADKLVLPLTVAFIVIAILAALMRMLLILATIRFAHAVGADISIEIYKRTLYQPYQVHVARNSSEVISGITSKVHAIVFELLGPLMVLISSLLLIIFLTGTLIYINPIIAMIIICGFGLSYGLITWLSRRRVKRNSLRIAYEQTQVVKALQEGLGGIRDVLIDGTQKVYCGIYRKADISLRQAQASNSFIASSPRYLMEAMGMVLIAILAYMLSNQQNGAAQALPVLAALALGAQRTLPALQQSYNSWISIAGCEASIASIIELLDQPIPEHVLQPLPVPLQFNLEIRFDAVGFRYFTGGPMILEGINLVIPKGARIGIVGSTGSGKSTAMDLLMGLLNPTEGQLLVDNHQIIGNKVRAWQQCIAHVPQSIYLADATIAENIAFGVPHHKIDMERVHLAARKAQIANFISERANGYDALVGERGIRLSGGQRQRIGIARALYKQASVLVFDEATSALDNVTEQSVMDAIDGLRRDLTILIIAHRLTTVMRCDTIVELERGRVVAQGSYEELMRSSASFRGMAASVV